MHVVLPVAKGHTLVRTDFFGRNYVDIYVQLPSIALSGAKVQQTMKYFKQIQNEDTM